MHRVHVFIPAASKDSDNAIAQQVFTDTGEADTFGDLKLRPIGSGSTEASHYACNAVVTEAQRSQLLNSLTTSGIQAFFYRLGIESEILQATNSSTATLQEQWSWDKSLADMNLEYFSTASPF